MKKDEYTRQMENELSMLYQIIEQCGVEIRIEDCIGHGGLTRIKKDRILFINHTLGPAEKKRVCLDALQRIDTEKIFLPPQIRRMLGEEDWNESD